MPRQRHCRLCGAPFIRVPCPACQYVTHACTRCGKQFRTHKLYRSPKCLDCRNRTDREELERAKELLGQSHVKWLLAEPEPAKACRLLAHEQRLARNTGYQLAYETIAYYSITQEQDKWRPAEGDKKTGVERAVASLLISEIKGITAKPMQPTKGTNDGN